MLYAKSALRNPEVSASGAATWAARREFVRDVTMAEKIASPSAPPIHVERLMSGNCSGLRGRGFAFVNAFGAQGTVG